MLIGQVFKLNLPTLAVGSKSGKSRAVSLPAGAVLTVVSIPEGVKDIVSVSLNGEVLGMFEVDLNTRGTEIREKAAGASC
jgi:hypothetical protein